MTKIHNSSVGHDAAPQLTPCEFTVCNELVNTALVHKQIAAKLGKSARTVEVQISSAYKKLGVTSRLELIQRFKSEGEVPVESLRSKGLMDRIMQRLNEIEHILDDLGRELSRRTARRVESISLVERRHAPASADVLDNVTPRRKLYSELHRGSAAR